MQFGITLDGGPNYGPIANFAALFIGCAFLVLACLIVLLPIRYGGVRKGIQSLADPILAGLKAGKLEPDTLSWRDLRTPRVLAVSEALRKELTAQRPIALVEALSGALDLLSGSLRQMIDYLRVVGWGTCLVSYLGTLSEALGAFKALALVNEGKFDPASITPVANGIAEAIRLQVYGLSVGLVCLAVAYICRNRLAHLYLEISDRVLKASATKVP
jgi:biopolymer transport protein ExbB/TolQ